MRHVIFLVDDCNGEEGLCFPMKQLLKYPDSYLYELVKNKVPCSKYIKLHGFNNNSLIAIWQFDPTNPKNHIKYQICKPCGTPIDSFSDFCDFLKLPEN